MPSYKAKGEASVYLDTFQVSVMFFRDKIFKISEQLSYLFGYDISLYRMGFLLPKQSENLDPSDKMDLDFLSVLGERQAYS